MRKKGSGAALLRSQDPLSRVRERGQKPVVLLATVLSMALAACTVGPDYVRPTMTTPP